MGMEIFVIGGKCILPLCGSYATIEIHDQRYTVKEEM
jgi:hypothetical protein